LSTSEGAEEALMDIWATQESSSNVSENGNTHSEVTSKDGGSWSNEVGGGGVWEVSGLLSSGISTGVHLLPIDGQTEDDSEDTGENSEVKVLSG
jgi:hypothetical protein